MTPAQIRGMIDRICGMYASHPVNKQGMKKAWVEDQFLLGFSVVKAREVIPVVEQHGKIPTLAEIKQMLERVLEASVSNVRAVDEDCEICGGSGWDSGVTPDNPEGYKRTENGSTYRFAKVCPCRS